MNVPVVYMGREVWIWLGGLDPEMSMSAAKYRGNSSKIKSMGKSEEFRNMAKSHFR
jgi:hypothetical protein